MTRRDRTTRDYALTFAALVGLTSGTVALSLLRLGPWHLAVGAAIGAVKAGLVVLVFMHLAGDRGRTWLAAAAGLFWLGILLVLTMADYLTRAEASY